MSLIEFILVICIIVLVLLLESQVKTTKKAYAKINKLEFENVGLRFRLAQTKKVRPQNELV